MESSQEELLRYNVKAGGGQWIGIQEGIPGISPIPAVVVFVSPITRRTINLPVERCASYDVQHAIVQDARPWYKEKIKVSRNDLFGIKESLTQIMLEIDQIIREEE
jgi:hypothetical protein